jgi:glycosyltransferase involved in cell wall biosynthesis
VRERRVATCGFGCLNVSRRVVVSAVNFSEGGPLTVLLESLDAAAATLGDEWEIIALVHNKDLIRNPRIRTMEFPESKRSWLRRLRLEWLDFKRLSRQLKPDLWLSLHDITPRVEARRQIVYCHNPSPFYAPSWREARFDPSFILFNTFYLRLYRQFIGRNHSVIVQQSWLREAFRRYTRHPNIVVAYPAAGAAAGATDRSSSRIRIPTSGKPLRLLYPALPRVFKNIETVCEAVTQLPDDMRPLVDLRLTFDGSESRWAAELARRYGNSSGISPIGRQDRAQMRREYESCDMVLFPSRLETWGLPISEAKSFGKPLLVADLPYARETVGTCDNVSFLPASDPLAWTQEICKIASGNWMPDGQRSQLPQSPFFSEWSALWLYMTKGL